MSRMDLHPRRTRLRRIFINPITVKELRATFRQRRFLLVYWISLIVYSLVVLWLAALEVSQDRLSRGEPVGQQVFNDCVAAQLALMLFVLPGFAATAVTDERENQSFDLLVTTALRAFDIVWGKFLACMGYAFLFLAATFPLVCISVLFTGVRPGEILFAYVVMTMVAALMTAIGLVSSSTGRSSRRSVAVTYALGLCVSAGWVMLGIWLKSAMPANYSKMNLVGYTYDLVLHSGFSSALWAGVLPVVMWAILLAILFIISVDRLKPTSANKSTNLRIVGVVLAATTFAVAVTDFLTSQVTLDQKVHRGIWVILLETGLLAIYLVGAACEEPRLSRRIQWQYQWAGGFKWPLRIFLPGSASGLVYVLFLTALLLGGSTWVLTEFALPTADSSASPVSLSRRPSAQTGLWASALLLASMIWCYAALGRWCSTIFAGAIYTRTVVIFVFVMANLVPVCLMTLADQATSDAGAALWEHASTLWNLHYTSTFLSVRSAWDMTGFWPLPDRGLFRSKLLVRTWNLNEPVAKVSAVFHLALAIVFTCLGAWRQRKVVRPHLKLLYPPKQIVPAIISTLVTSPGRP